MSEDWMKRPSMPVEPPPPYPGEHSLPTAEDAQTMAAFSGLPAKNKKYLGIVIGGVVALALLIGLSVGLSSGNKSRSSAAAEDPVQRLQEVQSFLTQFSDEVALYDTATPQYYAAAWIANDDGLQVPVPRSADYSKSFKFVQRYVLALMYFALNGYEWTYSLTGFLGPGTECRWNFGFNSSDPVPGGTDTSWKMGVQCNEQDEVDYIFLPSNNLAGQLPTELNHLQGIKHFSAYDNSLTGNLPQLDRWTKLEFLVLESNTLSGKLESWFNFPNLQYLDLGDNWFSGQLPSFSWGQNLRQVALDRNDFSGSIDAFNDVPNLETLFLQDNALTGSISDTTFATQPLVELDMSDNLIGGYFPQHFYDFEIVDLHNNSIGGNLPEVDYADYPIRFLSLYENSIEGPIPSSVGFLDAMTHLDLSYNSFNGPIPNDFNGCVNLEFLYLHRNDFDDGPFPNIFDLANLTELSLKGTNRTGPIPSWVGGDSFANLVLLDLHDNKMSGYLPEAMGSLTQLRFLFLNNNNFTGGIPDSFSGLESLAIITLDRNGFEGTDDAICGDNKPVDLNYFIGDCYGMTCNCCNKCCNENDYNCNNLEMSSNLDGTYERTQYVFSENLIFDIVNASDSAN